MTDPFESRLLESLSLIGEWVTVEELRQRGNIAKAPSMVEFILRRMKHATAKVICVGGRWGLPTWTPPKVAPARAVRNNSGSRTPKPKRPPAKKTKTGPRKAQGCTRAEVERLLAKRKNPEQIARHLGVTPATVNYHIKLIERELKQRLREAAETPPTVFSTTEQEESQAMSTVPESVKRDAVERIDTPGARAINDLSRLMENMQKKAEITDVDTKLDFLRRHSAFLEAHGADDAAEYMHVIRRDLAAAAGVEVA